jgi:hypothetical protein
MNEPQVFKQHFAKATVARFLLFAGAQEVWSKSAVIVEEAAASKLELCGRSRERPHPSQKVILDSGCRRRFLIPLKSTQT